VLIAPHVELVDTDVHDESRLTNLLHGCAAAINLVGILNERGHDGAGFEHAHTQLAEKLARACRDAGVPRLLQMSALKADADHGASHYLRSKGRAERAIARESGDEIAYTVFRPSVIFGPDDSLLNRFATLLRFLPVLPLARADARFAPVFVDDVAAAFVAALDDPSAHGRTYELCGPDLYSLAELVTLVRDELGLTRWIVPLPAPLGRLQAWLGEYLLPGKPLSLDNFASLGVASVCASNGLASLGVRAHALASVAPRCLGRLGRQPRLARLRRGTGARRR
jgi:NADH dehydrogenase